MEKIKLESQILGGSRNFVKPSHGLGTCGFSPKAWQIAPVKRGQSIVSAFLSCNPNWSIEEVTA